MSISEDIQTRLSDLDTAYTAFLTAHFPASHRENLQNLFLGSVLRNYAKRMQMLEDIYVWVYETVAGYKIQTITDIITSENPLNVEIDFDQFLTSKPSYTFLELWNTKE